MSLILSVIQSSLNKETVLGQAKLDLSADNLWRDGGSFVKSLVNESHVFLDKNGRPMKYHYSPQPQGTISFTVEVYHGMGAECGNVTGTPIDEYVRSVSRLAASAAFIFQSNTQQVISNFKPASSSSDPNGHKIETKMPMKCTEFDISCALNYTKKRMWIAMVNGFMYIYKVFGGELKLILDIAHFDYSIHPSIRYTVVSLHKIGYPSFHFFPTRKADFVRWKCVLMYSLRFRLQPNAKFSMELFIEDIHKLDSILGKKSSFRHAPRDEDGNIIAKTGEGEGEDRENGEDLEYHEDSEGHDDDQHEDDDDDERGSVTTTGLSASSFSSGDKSNAKSKKAANKTTISIIQKSVLARSAAAFKKGVSGSKRTVVPDISLNLYGTTQLPSGDTMRAALRRSIKPGSPDVSVSSKERKGVLNKSLSFENLASISQDSPPQLSLPLRKSVF